MCVLQWGDSSVWTHDVKMLGIKVCTLRSPVLQCIWQQRAARKSLSKVRALPGSVPNLRLQTRRLRAPVENAAARACGLPALFHHAPGGPRAASVAALRTA